MEKIGTGRKSFSLMGRPPRLFKSSKRGVKEQVEVFEPYEENLPLEAGYYSFVLDQDGKFRIKRGNHSSHATFVAGQPVGGAGQFRINRAGNVAEVFCRSIDYWLHQMTPASPTVVYVVNSFRNHHALELSPKAIFHFKQEKYDSFQVSIDKALIDDLDERLLFLDQEGQGSVPEPTVTDRQKISFLHYQPENPSRLYGIHEDQMTIDLESDELIKIEVGAAQAPLTPASSGLSTGKKAFVIDREGWLIVGHGHHLLSGGHPVGAAGQFTMNSNGEIDEIHLNFSGHYRPPLSAEYARYTFRTLLHHPLLKIAANCRITGRKFDETNLNSVNLRFTWDELLSDDPVLEESIEYSIF